MIIGFCWLWVHLYFSCSHQYVLFVLLGWFVKWEVNGFTAAVLSGAASRICLKQCASSLCSFYLVFSSSALLESKQCNCTVVLTRQLFGRIPIILSERSDFHMVSNWLISVNAFHIYFSWWDIVTKLMKWFTNFTETYELCFIWVHIETNAWFVSASGSAAEIQLEQVYLQEVQDHLYSLHQQSFLLDIACFLPFLVWDNCLSLCLLTFMVHNLDRYRNGNGVYVSACKTLVIMSLKSLIMAVTVSLEKQYDRSICSIFLLCIESNPMEKSIKKTDTSRFFACTLLMIW